MSVELDQDGRAVFRFGGGINSQGIPTDIHPRECESGQNFDLPADKAYLAPRRAARVVHSAGNSQPIRGFMQFIGSDGTRRAGFQAGGFVYRWSSINSSEAIATCSPAARLRGMPDANSPKDGVVIVTDLAREEVVKTWDGSTAFQSLSHNLTGDFYARYALVDGERALYGNVKAGSTDSPHYLVASAESDIDSLTVANKPSSSLSAADPFYIPTPNHASVSGLIPAFGKIAIPTKGEHWYRMNGVNAQDMDLIPLFAGRGGEGDEEAVFADNDIVFARNGSIDALSATERFGDVQSDDLSRFIRDEVLNTRSWMLAYSARYQKVYCVPQNGGKVYVLHTALLDQRIRAQLFGSQVSKEISPWSKWVTSHTFNFEPTAMMRMFHPDSGLETVFMGDGVGRIWQLESNFAADGFPDESAAVTVERTTPPIVTTQGDFFNIKGWVRARKMFGGTFTITPLWGGKQVFDGAAVTVTLDAADNIPVWGSGAYWGGGSYWNVSYGARLARPKKEFSVGGRGDQLQLKLSISSANLADYQIEEIGLEVEGGAMKRAA